MPPKNGKNNRKTAKSVRAPTNKNAVTISFQPFNAPSSVPEENLLKLQNILLRNPTFDDYYELAQTHAQFSEYDHTLHYLTIAAKMPDKTQDHLLAFNYLMGSSLYYKLDPDQAVPFLETAFGFLGVYCSENKLVGHRFSSSLFKRIVNYKGELARASKKQCQIQTIITEYTDAISLLTTSREKEHGLISTLFFECALCEGAINNSEDAIEHYLAALKHLEKDVRKIAKPDAAAQIHINLAILYFTQEQNSLAIIQYNKYLKNTEQHQHAWALMSLEAVHYQLACANADSDPDESLRHYKLALLQSSDTSPLKPYIYIAIGTLYHILESSKKAEENYTLALHCDTTNMLIETKIRIYRIRAECYDKLKKPAEAIIDYTYVINHGRDNDSEIETLSVIYMRRAACYTELAMHAEAIADYTHYINHHPAEDSPLDLLISHHLCGLSYFKMNRPKEASEHFNLAYALYTRDLEPRIEEHNPQILAWIHNKLRINAYQAKNLEQALSYALSALLLYACGKNLELKPIVDFQFTIGLLYLELKQFTKAIHFFMSALDKQHVLNRFEKERLYDALDSAKAHAHAEKKRKYD